MHVNPYEDMNKEGSWLKANLHSHAGTGPGTCGKYSVGEVLELYREGGHDVLCVSNHDLYTDTESLGTDSGLVLINGFEYSQSEHMLCIGCRELLTGDHQETVDACNAQGGFCILCHPHYLRKDYWALDKMKALEGVLGIEVFNGVIGRLEGTGWAEDVWDALLSAGKRTWGFANDDFHRWFDLHKAWNMVYSPSREKKDILSAFRKGCFVASTGLMLEEFSLEDGVIRVRAMEKGCPELDCRYFFIGQDGVLLHEHIGPKACYTLSGEKYVRVKAMGPQGFCLWCQPVYQKDCLKL